MTTELENAIAGLLFKYSLDDIAAALATEAERLGEIEAAHAIRKAMRITY